MKAAMNTPTRFNNARSSFVISEYDKNTKEMLLNYMKSFDISSAGGYVEDVFAEDISTGIEDAGYQDGEYFWSNQGIFFIEKYDIAVEKDFLDHVRRKMNRKAS